MPEKSNDDYNAATIGIGVLTTCGIIHDTLLRRDGDAEDGAGPCFVLIYLIFALVIVERIVRKIKSLLSKQDLKVGRD